MDSKIKRSLYKKEIILTKTLNEKKFKLIQLIPARTISFKELKIKIYII